MQGQSRNIDTREQPHRPPQPHSQAGAHPQSHRHLGRHVVVTHDSTKTAGPVMGIAVHGPEGSPSSPLGLGLSLSGVALSDITDLLSTPMVGPGNSARIPDVRSSKRRKRRAHRTIDTQSRSNKPSPGIEQRLPACSSVTRDRRHATRQRQAELGPNISDGTPEPSSARPPGLRSQRVRAGQGSWRRKCGSTKGA